MSATTIREQSDKLKEAAAASLPAEVAEVFARSSHQMRQRGVPTDAIAVGAKLSSFLLSDELGGPVTVDQLVARGPAVMVFYRGGWCPYCNLALRTYQQELVPQLGAFGATLVAISPQTPDQSMSTAEKDGLEFEVLSDRDSRLARRIGIAFEQPEEVLTAQRRLGLDLAAVNAQGGTWLPMPTVLIVDRDRTVRFIDVQPDYTDRTEVSEIVSALASIYAD